MTITLTHPAILTDTRADLLARGDLVDVTDEAQRLRFRHPVAVTREVWEDCIEWTDEIEAGKTNYSAQETQGRLRDVLWAALTAARAQGRGSRAYFTHRRVPTSGRGCAALPVTLTVRIHPGDLGEPVLTIGLPALEA